MRHEQTKQTNRSASQKCLPPVQVSNREFDVISVVWFPYSSFRYSDLPLQKIKGLGGKFGEDVCDKLKIKLMSELSAFSQADLQKTFDDKTGYVSR